MRKAYINLEEVCGNSISVVQGLFLTAMMTNVGTLLIIKQRTKETKTEEEKTC